MMDEDANILDLLEQTCHMPADYRAIKLPIMCNHLNSQFRHDDYIIDLLFDDLSPTAFALVGDEIHEMASSDPARYLKLSEALMSLRFPPYTYVPGKKPHPTSDPEGHSYDLDLPRMPPITDANWPVQDTYQRGVDFFNHGYYWEAHEFWEHVWMGVGRKGDLADFLKGLIHLAAAGVKAYEGRPKGVVSHCDKAKSLFEQVRPSANEGVFLGLRIDEAVAIASRSAEVLSNLPILSDGVATPVLGRLSINVY